MKTILVTGGNGYVGSVVCQMLLEEGYNVINVDRNTLPKSQKPEGITHFNYDISNRTEMRGLLKLSKPDAVIHLAASPSAPKSVLDPADTYQNNTANSINLLHHLIEFGVKHFVLSSTSSVYGENETGAPSEEGRECLPESPYGRSKLMIEDVLEDFDLAPYDFNYVTLRYFNAAGTYKNLGYKKEPAEHVLPILTQAVLTNMPFKIYGVDYDTPDGTPVRDYTHVEDIARAHINALDYLFNGGQSEVINLGSGTPKSVLELINEVEANGFKVKTEIADRRPGDPSLTCASNAKAQNLLGWTPKHDISKIVKDELEWAQKQIK